MDANADVGGSIIALCELCSEELKNHFVQISDFLWHFIRLSQFLRFLWYLYPPRMKLQVQSMIEAVLIKYYYFCFI